MRHELIERLGLAVLGRGSGGVHRGGLRVGLGVRVGGTAPALGRGSRRRAQPARSILGLRLVSRRRDLLLLGSWRSRTIAGAIMGCGRHGFLGFLRAASVGLVVIAVAVA